MNLANNIEVVPVWKKRKRIYYVNATIYRKYYGPVPVPVTIDIF
jgi:hypothetical protein